MWIISKYFFENNFATGTPYVFSPVSKMLYNFSLKLTGKWQTRYFSALVQKLKNKFSKWKQISLWLVAFKRLPHLEVEKHSTIHFILNFLDSIVW